MRFKVLTYNNSTITNSNKIQSILEKEKLYWLIESEIEDAQIEIKNSTLIWHNGYFFGDWYYGIFKNGDFHGTFRNGILEGGNFKGKFVSGINLIEI